MYKHDDSLQLMCVRRDNSTHQASPRRRHSNDDRVQGNELPTTTSLDDMIDALDHDIIRVVDVDRSSSDGASSHSRRDHTHSPPLSLQLLN